MFSAAEAGRRNNDTFLPEQVIVFCASMPGVAVTANGSSLLPAQ
jgi:hypothetical protein